jgi:hypothetical protein
MSEEFHNFYSSIKFNEYESTAYRVLMETPEGEKVLGRARGRWEDNIKCIVENRMGRYGLL